LNSPKRGIRPTIEGAADFGCDENSRKLIRRVWRQKSVSI
jgi:hypothetical protein